MSLEEMCEYKQIAELQREHELARGLGPEWIKSYEDIGCYSCDGLYKDCPCYTVIYEPSMVKIS